MFFFCDSFWASNGKNIKILENRQVAEGVSRQYNTSTFTHLSLPTFLPLFSLPIRWHVVPLQ